MDKSLTSLHQASQQAPSRMVSIFRGVFFGIALAFIAHAIDANLSPFGLVASATVGALIGYWCAEYKLTRRRLGNADAGMQLSKFGFALLVVVAALAWLGIRFAGDATNPFSTTDSQLTWYLWSRSAELFLLIAAVLSVMEFLYRRTASWLSVEIIGIAATALSALSAHYQFRLDSPRTIAEVAWNWNSNPIGVFIGVGALITFILLIFTAVCRKPSGTGVAQHSRFQIAAALVSLAALVSIIAYSAFTVTSVNAGARLMNGVGQNKDPGVSPLSFQSALGATNQPAALVRLESDYPDNPFSPMLYLREDALSEYNGKELVHAVGAYDNDVISTPPSQTYKANAEELSPTRMGERRSVPHSVYLLADHKVPFGLDVPMALVPLKNPNPGKFKGGTYRVYSQAPIYKLEEIRSLPVGDPAWDAVERAHYLKRNPDARYEELAVTITAGTTTPVERAFALAQYLSAKSIYTLQPNHAPTKGDETAPYLFGDLRGYCVHFAHAMVYMLRTLGIPSRIGTGYLTDLSQAKDGHILLRMSDRHAWAEVFIESKGWVPFDVQPEQVESHGDSEIDMKLLEELMSQIDPGEEILPETPTTPEPGLTKPDKFDLGAWIPGWKTAGGAVVGILLLIGACNLLAKYVVWRLPLGARRQLNLAYRAEVLAAAECGIVRAAGETREQFAARTSAILNASTNSHPQKQPLSVTAPLNAARFGSPAGSNVTSNAASDQKSYTPTVWLPLPWWKRIIALCSLRPLRRYLRP